MQRQQPMSSAKAEESGSRKASERKAGRAQRLTDVRARAKWRPNPVPKAALQAHPISGQRLNDMPARAQWRPRRERGAQAWRAPSL